MFGNKELKSSEDGGGLFVFCPVYVFFLIVLTKNETKKGRM